MYKEEANTITFMHYVENSHNTNGRFNWVDDDLYTFLKNGHKNNIFNNTAIFLFSDHGSRFTDKKTSKNRYLEERMPFFSIYLPESFKAQNQIKYTNLKENLNYLTSPFDIYATVRDLTGLEPLVDPKAKSPELQRSISLLNKISPERNCEHIGISDHFCICVKQWVDVDINNVNVSKAVEFTMQIINSFTNSMRHHCAKLSLRQVITAELLIRNKFSIYKIQFITNPNRGVYETLLYNSFNKNFDTHEFKLNKFSIKSRHDISRIDGYGDQPKCIADFKSEPNFNLDLRKFCFCKPISSYRFYNPRKNYLVK